MTTKAKFMIKNKNHRFDNILRAEIEIAANNKIINFAPVFRNDTWYSWEVGNILSKNRDKNTILNTTV